MARCGENFRKPVQSISDRAKRYRAHSPGCRPKGPKRCHWCGTRNGQIVPDHKDGDESNGRPSNLVWACKPCNTERGKKMAKAGKGVRTRQYNPKHRHRKGWELVPGTRSTFRPTKKNQPKRQLVTLGPSDKTMYALEETKDGKKFLRGPYPRRGRVYELTGKGKNPGAINLAQYVQAAVDHTRGSHDAGGKVIHETPKSKRREFAREIAFRKRHNPEKPESQKLTHAAVKFESPSRHPGQACASCVHLIAASPPRCEGVKNPIKAGDWCKRYKRRGKNPGEADELYRKFHGRGPDKILTMQRKGMDPYGGHPELTSLGPLIRLVVGEGVEMNEDGTVKDEGEWVNEICFVPMPEYRRRIERLNTKDQEQVREFKAWLKAAGAPDVAAVPDTPQLYFVGGKQSLGDAEIRAMGAEPKDLVDLGFVYLIEYCAQKRFDRFEVMTYFHAFGEKTGVQPRLIFRKHPPMLELVGGEYQVKSVGIDN